MTSLSQFGLLPAWKESRSSQLTRTSSWMSSDVRAYILHLRSIFFNSKYKNVYCSERLQHLRWSKLTKKGKRCVQITRDASSFCEKSLKLHLLRWEILSRSRSCGYLRDPLLFMCVFVVLIRKWKPCLRMTLSQGNKRGVCTQQQLVHYIPIGYRRSTGMSLFLFRD